MPWILWRHLLTELLKVLLLTASVIVVVVAFGAAIKPLADNSLGPGSVLKYVSLAMVPMLQFALPFAAGFAATIVVHRFAVDNEFVAMAASGIRHRTVMGPVIILGVLLFAAMLWLVNTVVPEFWGRMRDTIAQDAAAVFVAAVERGEALDAGELTIYADAVSVEPAPADSGATQRLRLSGVAAIQRDRAGHSATEFMSEGAIVDVHRRDGATVMKLSMSNGTGFRAAEGTVAFVPQAAPDAVEIGRAAERDSRSTTTAELQRIRQQLDGEVAVQQELVVAASILDRVDLLQCIERTLASAGAVTLRDDVTGRRYRIEHAAALGAAIAPAPGATWIDLVELDGERPVRRAEAASARLAAASSGEGQRVDLACEALRAFDVGSGDPIPTRWPVRLRDLRVIECPSAQRAAAGSDQLLSQLDALASAGGPNAAEAAGAAVALRTRLGWVDRDASSNVLQRLALAASAPLVLLLGAALAAWKRDSLPLTIYLLAFLPAILNIVTIAGGQQMMRSGAVTAGSLVMWSGNALLVACFTLAYTRWARH